MPDHKTVKVPCPWLEGEKSIDIDEKLAPLIRLLWEMEIDTNQCCQEYHPGLANIEFPGTGEVMEFLGVAQQNYKVEVETWDEGKDGKLAIAVRLLVIFPTTDIPKLVKTFRAAQARKAKEGPDRN